MKNLFLLLIIAFCAFETSAQIDANNTPSWVQNLKKKGLDEFPQSELDSTVILQGKQWNAATQRWEWVKTDVDSLRSSFNSSINALRPGVPFITEHPADGVYAKEGIGDAWEFGDTTGYYAVYTRNYPLNFYSGEFNFFQSRFNETNGYMLNHHFKYNGLMGMNRRGGTANLNLNSYGVSSDADGGGIDNFRGGVRFIGIMGRQTPVFNQSEKTHYLPIVPYTPVVRIQGNAVFAREDSTRLYNVLIGRAGYETGSDTLSTSNHNSRFVVTSVANGETDSRYTFVIEDTSGQRWSGEQYISDSSGIAFFDKNGRLDRDASSFLIQKSAKIELSYEPSSSTDFQNELLNRTTIPDGTEFYFHASGVSYKYIYDESEDKIKRTVYSEF